jgi:hypothetical protein
MATLRDYLQEQLKLPAEDRDSMGEHLRYALEARAEGMRKAAEVHEFCAARTQARKQYHRDREDFCIGGLPEDSTEEEIIRLMDGFYGETGFVNKGKEVGSIVYEKSGEAPILVNLTFVQKFMGKPPRIMVTVRDLA